MASDPKTPFITNEEALEYHSGGRRGKIEVVPTKPCQTQRDLALAYTPGVARPCIEIEKDPGASFEYTSRSNLVAVVTNGTAVLGLGNIGPRAAKPVMEGKAILFKQFADIDVFDLEVSADDPKEFINVIQRLETTFGGINLEDVRAPDCFEIEHTLVETMNIPIFHDDQHGTAVITTAALINALELVGKKVDGVHVVFSGAGAAAVACAHMFVALGVPQEHIILCDRRGVIFEGREATEPFRAEFALKTDKRTLADAMKGADVFIGLSNKDLVSPEMLASMAPRPIVFAMANPDPEIPYPVAKEVRSDAIIATGRSDYPNQVNNVLGFPFIFRGTLDVGALRINEPMKMAAAKALAELARQPVPEEISGAYGNSLLEFGPDYIIPKPIDPRVLLYVAPAVAKAAVDSGVAHRPIEDFDAYQIELRRLLERRKNFVPVP